MRGLYILFTFLLSTHWVVSQVTISDEFSNERISNVLRAWSSKYAVDFAYDNFELARYRFSGKFTNTGLEEALGVLLKQTPFDFKWLNETCIIYPQSKATQSSTIQPSVGRRLSGRIVDRLSGESLPYASIGALKAGVGATSDFDGKFSLSYSSVGITDTLVVAYIGYELFRTVIDWDALPITLTCELVRTDAVLPDVLIQSQHLKTIQQETAPGVFTMRPNSSGLRSGIGESDVFRLAQFAAGISGSQENSNGLFIRGSSSGQSQLLLDGFNIYHQDHFFGMFSSVNSYAVKSMRINKVFNDPSQGGRTAGSVELMGREGDLRQPSGRIEMGTMSVSGALETPLDSSGKAALFICGRRSLTDFIKGPAYREIFRTLYSASVVSASVSDVDEAAQKFNPQLLFQDINAKLTIRPTGTQLVNASFYASRDALSFNYADTSSAESVNVSDIRYSDESAKSNRGMSLRWLAEISPRLEVMNSIGYSQFRGFYFSTDSIRNNLFAVDSTQYSFLEVALRDWSILDSWKWKCRNQELKWGAALNYVATNNSRRNSENPDSLEIQSGFITTIFAGDEIRTKRWLIQPGLRMSVFGFSPAKVFWEPRFSMRYTLLPSKFYFKLAATRSLQFVQRITNQSLYQNVPDRWQLAGNGIPVLTANQLLLGINYTHSYWSADLEGYLKTTHGQVLDANAGQFSSTNVNPFYVGDASALGVDVTFQYERASHKLLFGASWLNAHSNYPGLDVTDVAETYNRAMEGKLAYEWTKGAWNASIFFIAADGSPYTALLGSYSVEMPDGSQRTVPVFGGYNRGRTQAYMRTDIACSYGWNWKNTRWQIVASVYNVFDTSNYRAVQYSVSPSSSQVNAREILMLGRIPSLNLIGQF